MASEGRINIREPLWDQSTFYGRFRHFAFISDPRLVFTSNNALDKAKLLYCQYDNGIEPKGTTLQEVIRAKKLYESSFHPDSGERQNVFGRMSFQVPGGMILSGCMMQFYKTSTAVIFWQWVNQSFNALVNYTNRNANNPVSPAQLVTAYVSATASALAAALGCKKYFSTRASPLFQRFVPLIAVIAANCVNIPLMRQNELQDGITLVDKNDNKLTESRLAAAIGISEVVLSRIVMATPGMIILPIIFEKIQCKPWYCKYPAIHAPLSMLGCGLILLFMVPAACGLFPQRATIDYCTLKNWEPTAIEKLKRTVPPPYPRELYFNKGL